VLNFLLLIFKLVDNDNTSVITQYCGLTHIDVIIECLRSKFETTCWAFGVCRFVVQGKRFDPDMPQTLRLEFARSNTKVSKKPKPQHDHQHHHGHQHYQQASIGPHHLLLQQQQQQQQQLALGRTALIHHPLAARTTINCLCYFISHVLSSSTTTTTTLCASHVPYLL